MGLIFKWSYSSIRTMFGECFEAASPEDVLHQGMGSLLKILPAARKDREHPDFSSEPGSLWLFGRQLLCQTNGHNQVVYPSLASFNLCRESGRWDDQPSLSPLPLELRRIGEWLDENALGWIDQARRRARECPVTEGSIQQQFLLRLLEVKADRGVTFRQDGSGRFVQEWPDGLRREELRSAGRHTSRWRMVGTLDRVCASTCWHLLHDSCTPHYEHMLPRVESVEDHPEGVAVMWSQNRYAGD